MRKHSIRILLCLLCLSASATLAACDSGPPALDALTEPLLKDFKRDTLQIRTRADTPLELAVYIARSDEEMSQGLMFVESLPKQTGMLFTYPRRRIGSMWMKNTVLSLDIFFINSKGEITDIHRNATPKSMKSMRSTGRVRGALELVAGSADKLDIREGDVVLHEHFKTR